jgi:ABC-type multidrug transport system fused ATPase/permease subunit
MVLFCFAILVSISWKITLVALALVPAHVPLFVLPDQGRFVKTLYRQTDDSEGKMTDKISENLAAVRIVKAFNAERYEISSFENSLTDYKKKFIRWRRLSAFFFSSSDIFVFGSKLLSLLYGIYLCYAEYQGQKSTPAPSSFPSAFVNMMVWPLRECRHLPFEYGPIHRLERPGPPHS